MTEQIGPKDPDRPKDKNDFLGFSSREELSAYMEGIVREAMGPAADQPVNEFAEQAAREFFEPETPEGYLRLMAYRNKHLRLFEEVRRERDRILRERQDPLKE